MRVVRLITEIKYKDVAAYDDKHVKIGKLRPVAPNTNVRQESVEDVDFLPIIDIHKKISEYVHQETYIAYTKEAETLLGIPFKFLLERAERAESTVINQMQTISDQQKQIKELERIGFVGFGKRLIYLFTGDRDYLL